MDWYVNCEGGIKFRAAFFTSFISHITLTSFCLAPKQTFEV